MLNNNYKNEFITFLKQYNIFMEYRYKLIYNTSWTYSSLPCFFKYVDALNYFQPILMFSDYQVKDKWRTCETVWLIYLYTFFDLQEDTLNKLVAKLNGLARNYFSFSNDKGEIIELINDFKTKLVKGKTTDNTRIYYDNLLRFCSIYLEKFKDDI